MEAVAAESVCALAADTKVETPEGGLAIRSIAGKAVAVFTREPQGRVRFRMMQNVRKTAEQQPIWKVTIENGQSFRVAPEQVVFKRGMVECPAALLQVGDALEPAFHYPVDYHFHDSKGAALRSAASWRVQSVGPDGTADLYTFGVNRTGSFFVSAGVLCKAEQP